MNNIVNFFSGALIGFFISLLCAWFAIIAVVFIKWDIGVINFEIIRFLLSIVMITAIGGGLTSMVINYETKEK